ncbi:hypothetical protein X731_16235 [Mesorhizobium sp. L2C054A000]|nr:hypothetical protein X731_16235 [Mesorhizobium sp. L2C054A000]
MGLPSICFSLALPPMTKGLSALGWGTNRTPKRSACGTGKLAVRELNNEQRRAISRLIRKWITSETIRRHLRELLKLPVETELPKKHQSLLDEIEGKRNGR